MNVEQNTVEEGASGRLGDKGRKALVRLVLQAYTPPAVLFAVAIVPGFNVLYSGHGGLAWFLGLLAFPTTVLLLVRAGRSKVGLTRGAQWRFVAQSFAVFLVAALLASAAGAASIRNSFGLTLRAWDLWILLATPFGWLLFA
jgi:hypothetical protein